MPSNNPNALDVFVEWTLYDKVIHFNYMRHQEMAAVISQCAKKISEPLHVVDLGCGDGRLAVAGLSNCNVASYVGIDLTASALLAAKQNLAGLSDSVTLHESNLATALGSEFSHRPNLVIASYSLHHFERSDIDQIVSLLASSVAPGGTFLWIDLERQRGEHRDDFLKRFWKDELASWTEFSPEQAREVVEHMSSADFPLTALERSEVAERAGLRRASQLYGDTIYAADCFVRT